MIMNRGEDYQGSWIKLFIAKLQISWNQNIQKDSKNTNTTENLNK